MLMEVDSDRLFWSYKEHVGPLVTACQQVAVSEEFAWVVLEGWRKLRAAVYAEMEPTERALIQARNLLEFGDAVGPTRAYFCDSHDVVERFVGYNGQARSRELQAQRNLYRTVGLRYAPELAQSARVAVVFRATGDAATPLTGVLDGREALIRVQLFPDELLYALIVDRREIDAFNAWPERWTKPGRNTGPHP